MENKNEELFGFQAETRLASILHRAALAGVQFDDVVPNAGDTGPLPREVMAHHRGVSEWNPAVAA